MADLPPQKPSPILSTIRLQLHKEFTFLDALKHVDYFHHLGITHIYSSPILTARKHSTHGYDIVDPTQINPELGGRAGLEALVEKLRSVGMGLIVDTVPNHMGVGGSENPWWQHVIEWGEKSPYAIWFDIEWNPKDPQIKHKILAPFLENPYGVELDEGKIRLIFDESSARLSIQYFNNLFPIKLSSYANILRRSPQPNLLRVASLFDAIDYRKDFHIIQEVVEAARKELNHLYQDAEDQKAIIAALQDFDPSTATGRLRLHDLIEEQLFRLTWWRNAADEINWRRFFEVTELVGVRVELDEVFEATHSLIFDLYSSGLIDGVRLDHIDGLAHPREYCRKLRARLQELERLRPEDLRFPAYIIAEKILGEDENLRPEWNLDGTTGYEFMDQVGALFHDKSGEKPLTDLWQRITGDQYDFGQHVKSAKRQILEENLVGEFNFTADALQNIARFDIQTRDYSYAAIQRTLKEILIHFPVYRSYVSVDGPDQIDSQIFETTASEARRRLSHVDKPLVNILLSWLSAALVNANPEDEVSDLSQRAITRFQQLLPPLMAKSTEDTAFYRYGRLLSRNEVGSNPGTFSISPGDFHRACADRLQLYPANLLATATHDNKRDEDVRMRVAVLAQLHDEWEAVVTHWFIQNESFRTEIYPEEDKSIKYLAPRPWHELMFYQTLVGAWPYDLDPTDPDGLKHFESRLQELQIKSIREAKRMSTWVQANETYEAACAHFIAQVLDPEKNSAFLGSVYAFVQSIRGIGALHSLSQTLLRMTTPGIPDLYQGRELWELSLVDPDNRRPVNYDLRKKILDDSISFPEMSMDWHDGAIKQYLIKTILNYRKEHSHLFRDGTYEPLDLAGLHQDEFIAFIRRHDDDYIIIITPIILKRRAANDAISYSQDDWGDTGVILPGYCKGSLKNLLGDRTFQPQSNHLLLSDIFASLPLGALVPDSKSPI